MARKRVEAEDTSANATMVRGKDGSAFAKCEDCKKDVPVALISMHSCSLEARIKMNLEAQVVEKAAEPKKKPAERKKSTSTEPKAKRAKKADNPNKLKRPATAFFVFLDEFRKAFKEANPDAKDVKRVAKEGGEKWKALSDEEKKPYLDKAAELKAEYVKALEQANDAENEDEGDAADKEEDVADKKDGEEEVHEVSDNEE
ncbi:high mobility group B protein 7-like [Mercurialis annua]|uniref:high mobility group B protein 7-like n=1 Tax=Mercurialis annua TaxID=3986 RepID=UPI00215F2063|nr:high mobility group B protein 7-like [Mercurialis annua]